MTVYSRGAGIMGFFLSVNALLFFSGLLFLFGNERRMIETGTGDYGLYLRTFFFTVLLLLLAVLFLVPARTVSSVSKERDSGTLDVMLASGLSPLRIASGTFFSAFLLSICILFSCFPALFLPLIYGGVSFSECLYVLLSFVPLILFLLSCGLFGSSAGKSQVSGICICYGLILALMAGPVLLSFLIKPFFEAGKNTGVCLMLMCPGTSVLSMLLDLTGGKGYLRSFLSAAGYAGAILSPARQILISSGISAGFSALLFFLAVKKM